MDSLRPMRHTLGWALLFSWWSVVPWAWGAGPSVEMSSRDGVGFAIARGDPLGGWFEEGLGRSAARVDPRRGGSGELDISLPGGTYRVALERAEVAWNVTVHGPGSPWGLDGAVPAPAIFALHGAARLWWDGQDQGTLPTQVYALRAGTHADDATHALQPAARERDLELEWLVLLPSGAVLRFFFDDVRLEGADLSQVGRAPAVEGTAPPNVGLSALTAPVQSPAPPRAGIFPVEISTLRVRNATPLPRSPSPANASPGTPLPRTVEVNSGSVFVPLPATPSPVNAAGAPPPTPIPPGSGLPGQTVSAVPALPSLQVTPVTPQSGGAAQGQGTPAVPVGR